MTPAEIAALRALARGTSDGPWVAYRDVDGTWHVRTDTGGPEFDYGVADIPQARLGYSSPIDYRDASFIAAARTAVPELLDEVERLRGALRGMLTRHGEPGPTNPFRCVCFDCETARRVLGEAGKEEG